MPFMVLRSSSDEEMEHLLNEFENACADNRGAILDIIYSPFDQFSTAMIRYEDYRGAQMRFKQRIKQSNNV